jgi:hypothetical protein
MSSEFDLPTLDYYDSTLKDVGNMYSYRVPDTGPDLVVIRHLNSKDEPSEGLGPRTVLMYKDEPEVGILKI